MTTPASNPSIYGRLRRRPELLAAAALTLGFAVGVVLEPRLISVGSLRSILLWLPLVIVVAMGQTLVILSRGIDVSVGSTMGLAGMCVAMLFRDHPSVNVYLGASIGVLIGGLLGTVNGCLVVLCRAPPIVATLGTMGIYRGLTHIVSRGVQVEEYELPHALSRWSVQGPFGQTLVPWIVVVAFVTAGLAAVLMRYTRTGRNIYAVGGNPDAARLRGVRVGAVTWMVYALCGASAGLAGTLYASRFGTVNPGSIGMGFELVVISAVVVGGISVFGGRGSIGGVLVGCALLATIYTSLTVLGVSPAWQSTSYGLAILAAVVLDEVLRSRAERGSRTTR